MANSGSRTEMQTSPPGQGSRWFTLLCGLAYVGGVIAYLPVLSLLLPVKVEAIAGAGRLDVFTACVVAGGIAASASNILFGWLSDLTRTSSFGRRQWIMVGLVAVVAGLASVVLAKSTFTIIAAVAFFQVTVNILLAPMAALLAEEVDDAHKGLLGGLMSIGYPTAAFFAWAVAYYGFTSDGALLIWVFLGLSACVLPLLLSSSRGIQSIELPDPEQGRTGRKDLWVAWAARLLIQVAGSVLSLYLLYYFESLNVSPARLAPAIGVLLGIGHLIPVPFAIWIGRWSDRIDRRKPILTATALLSALGLVGMIFAYDWWSGAIAFCVYAMGSSIFLALHASFSMQLLPDPDRRGRDLGLINLANTLPILVGPTLTWALSTPKDFSAALLTLAILSVAGGLVILGVRGRN